MPQSQIKITLSEWILSALKRWAAKEGTPPATLAGFWVEKAVRDAIAQGIISAEASEPSISEADKFADRAKQFLRAKFLGESIEDLDLEELASDLGITPERLHQELEHSEADVSDNRIVDPSKDS